MITFFIIFGAKAQDSIVDSSDKFTLKKLILPATLVTVGAIFKTPFIQRNIQQEVRRTFGDNFQFKGDDYFQFVPAAQMLTGDLIGFKSKHGFKQKLTNLAISNAIVGVVIYTAKSISNDNRPDNSARNSFPSGHNATAFNNATLLFLEYRNDNIWYASSGYLFAVSTAVLRMANNRHWSGDVFAGAGIGCATAIIVNCWSPFKFDKKNKNIGLIGYPVINDKNYGIGLVYQIK
jgi:membrane-associated phospholipid phosphatase